MSDPGSDVLVRATISDDGRSVRIAPGVEVRAEAVDIITTIPPVDEAYPLVMFFGSEVERELFAGRVERGLS